MIRGTTTPGMGKEVRITWVRLGLKLRYDYLGRTEACQWGGVASHNQNWTGRERLPLIPCSICNVVKARFDFRRPADIFLGHTPLPPSPTIPFDPLDGRLTRHRPSFWAPPSRHRMGCIESKWSFGCCLAVASAGAVDVVVGSMPLPCSTDHPLPNWQLSSAKPDSKARLPSRLVSPIRYPDDDSIIFPPTCSCRTMYEWSTRRRPSYKKN